jgi:transposase
VALVLRLQEKTVASWVRGFCGDGLPGAPRPRPTGRPPTLTPAQNAELLTLIDAGPLQAGFRSACWRSPMMQPLIGDRFGVFSHVFSSAPFLKNLGLSSPKAAFVAAHLDAGKRQTWHTTTWPQLLGRANARKALLRCGDEASFPQGGTLSYTWACRGQQPPIKTCGQRTGSQVFGLIDSCTGSCWDQGQEGRLHSTA